MKPFNLERMLAGDPVITRDKRKVIDYKLWENSRRGYDLTVQLDNPHKDVITLCKKTGCFELDENSPLDLFMAPIKKTYYIGIYKTSKYVTTSLFEKEELLNTFARYHDVEILEIARFEVEE